MSLVEPTRIDFSAAKAVIQAEKLRRTLGIELPTPRTLANDEWPPNYGNVLAWRQKQLARYQENPELIERDRLWYRYNPEDFINHWIDTYDPRNLGTDKPVWMPMILFARQGELVRFLMKLMEADTRGMVEKSRDMGATWVCIGFSLWLWLFHPGIAIGWGSNLAENVDVIGKPGSIFEKMRLAIRRLPSVWIPEGLDNEHYLKQNLCFNPSNGSSISGQVGKNIGRGDRVRLYFVDEAAHLEHPEAAEAALSATTNVRIDVSSVSGPGTVFHRNREAGVEWTPTTEMERGKTYVFVMDSSDHPARGEEWRRVMKETYRTSPHIFAREYGRNYMGAQDNVVIPADYVLAAIDAHIKLGFEASGPVIAALDIADGGIDVNALAITKGPLILELEEMEDTRDTGVTTRNAIARLAPYLAQGKVVLQYDASVIGSGVKAEVNRLRDEKLLSDNLIVVPWLAAGKVEDPNQPFNKDARPKPGEPPPPTNDSMFKNRKAQAAWNLRVRFENTYLAVSNPDRAWVADDLISLPSTLPFVRKAQQELSQPTYGPDARMKMIVNKAPDGARSPNLFDVIMMAYFPVKPPPAPTTSFFGPRIVRG